MKKYKVISIFCIIFLCFIYFYAVVAMQRAAQVGRTVGPRISTVQPRISAPITTVKPPSVPAQVPSFPTISGRPTTMPIKTTTVPTQQPYKGLELPKQIPLQEEAIVEKPTQQKILRPILKSFFSSQILPLYKTGTAIGFISEQAAHDLIAHDPAYKELFQAKDTVINNKEGKWIFRANHNDMGYAIQFKKSKDVAESELQPTLYSIFGAVEPAHRRFLDANFPFSQVDFFEEQANSSGFKNIDILFKSALENTATKQKKQQEAAEAAELVQKRAALEKLKAEELKTKQALEKAQEAELADKIEQEKKDIAQQEQHLKDIAEINALEQEIFADLDAARQQTFDNVKMEFEKEEVAIQEQINTLGQNIKNIESNEKKLEQELKTLELEQQHNVQEQQRAKSEKDVQIAQQKEQDARAEQKQVEQEQADLETLRQQNSAKLDSLKQQQARVEETYKQQLEAIEKDQQKFNEQQQLNAQERAQQNELAEKERALQYTQEMMDVEKELQTLNQQIAQQTKEITQRKAQHLADIEARTEKELQAFEQEQATQSEQEKQQLVEQRLAEKAAHDQQSRQEEIEISEMESQFHKFLQQRKDLQKIQQELILAQQKEAHFKEQLIIPEKPTSPEALIVPEKEIIEKGEGGGSVSEEEGAEKQEEHLELPQVFAEGVQKIAMPQIEPLLEAGAETIDKPEITEPVENIKKPEIKEISRIVEKAPEAVMTQPISYTAPSYTPLSLPSRRERMGVNSITTPIAQPAAGGVIVRTESVKREREKPKEEPKSVYDYQLPYRGVPGYEESRTYEKQQYAGGTPVEETPEIPYTGQGDIKKAASTQSRQAIKKPEPLPQPVIKEEALPEEEIWRPLPKKIWPQRPQEEKLPEVPPVNWFWRLVMRVVDYFNKLFGK
jgi:hypothetical protein